MGHSQEERLKKVRDSWINRGDKRPPFAIEPKKGQRSVWDFPRPPVIENVTKKVCIKYLGKTIVDTCNSLAVLETASPPTYYIPQKDIDLDVLQLMPGKSSFCEWKGNALYWVLKQREDLLVAWSYPNPLPEFEALKGFLAFYPHDLECFVDGNMVKPQPGKFYAGWITSDLTGPFKGDSETSHW